MFNIEKTFLQTFIEEKGYKGEGLVIPFKSKKYIMIIDDIVDFMGNELDAEYRVKYECNIRRNDFLNKQRTVLDYFILSARHMLRTKGTDDFIEI